MFTAKRQLGRLAIRTPDDHGCIDRPSCNQRNGGERPTGVADLIGDSECKAAQQKP